MISIIDDYWSPDRIREAPKLNLSSLPPLPPSPEPTIELYTTVALIYYPTDQYNRIYNNPVWIEKITQIEKLIEKNYPVVTCCVANPHLLSHTHAWIHLRKSDFTVSCDTQEKIIPYNTYGVGSVFISLATTSQYFEATAQNPVFDHIHDLLSDLNRIFGINGSLNICLMSPEPVDDEDISHDWYLLK